MKIVQAGYECVNDAEFSNPLQKVERVARICYKSEDKITADSYKKMTKVLMERQHLAMFEHASLVFEIDERLFIELEAAVNAMCTQTNQNEHAEVMNVNRLRMTRTRLNEYEERFIVSANLRAYYEFFRKAVGFKIHTANIASLYQEVNSRIDNLFNITDLKIMPICCLVKQITNFSNLTVGERLIHETFTVIFTCDRGVTHELVRMRDASFAQESTRYCNYQLGKFGNEITVIKPYFFEQGTVGYLKWQDGCEYTEKVYFALLEGGATPQEARSVLPTSVKADIALTTNLYEWRHIFNLRAYDATGPAHPQMKEIMVPLCKEMIVKYPEVFGKLEVKE